jgi:hypothetical protein
VAKPTPYSVALGTRLGVPSDRTEAEVARDELIAEISDSPAFTFIAEYLEHAKALGLDPTQTEVIRSAITAGEAAWVKHVEAVRAKTIWGAVTSDLSSSVFAHHRPIVYYARMGELVKIGTSTQIVKRRSVLGVQGILAVEAGDSGKEHERHVQFADLRSHGEWFHPGPALADHIVAVRASFEAEAGVTVEAWMDEQRKRDSDLRALRLLKVNGPLYSGGATSLPASRPMETLVTGSDAARVRRISPQLLNGWREQGKIRPVGAAADGRPLYRLSEIIHLDNMHRASPQSFRHNP